MSRVKYNLVGDTFTHLTNGNKGYSVHGKESKYLEWSNDNPFAQGTFYIDNTINNGINDGRKGPKYLWLLESKYIKQGLVESIIANGYHPNDVNKITSLILKNEYKRRQSAPGPKVSNNAFGKERRYPMTSKFKP